MIPLLVLVVLSALATLVYVVRRMTVTVPTPAEAVSEPPTAAPERAEPGTVVVTLGNEAVAQVVQVPDEHGLIAPRRVARPDLGQRVTTFGPFPADWPPSEIVKALAHGWTYHSDAAPAWLECNDATIEDLLAAELKCPRQRPADWQEDE